MSQIRQAEESIARVESHDMFDHAIHELISEFLQEAHSILSLPRHMDRQQAPLFCTALKNCIDTIEAMREINAACVSQHIIELLIAFSNQTSMKVKRILKDCRVRDQQWRGLAVYLRTDAPLVFRSLLKK